MGILAIDEKRILEASNGSGEKSYTYLDKFRITHNRRREGLSLNGFDEAFSKNANLLDVLCIMCETRDLDDFVAASGKH